MMDPSWWEHQDSGRAGSRSTASDRGAELAESGLLVVLLPEKAVGSCEEIAAVVRIG